MIVRTGRFKQGHYDRAVCSGTQGADACTVSTEPAIRALQLASVMCFRGIARELMARKVGTPQQAI